MKRLLTVLFAGLMIASQASAVSISATAATPTGPVFFGPYIGPFDTGSSPSFATFNFSGSYTSLPTFDSVSFSLVASGIQTLPADQWNNKISLTLGGIDTGLLLNGYHDFPTIDTLTFTGTISPAAASGIYSYMAANGGMLSAGLRDISGAANTYFFTGASTSLTITDSSVAVPFEPASALGLGMLSFLAAFGAYRKHGLAGIKRVLFSA